MSDAVLLSGDEDLRVGVLLAQQFGVRLHLVGIRSSQGNQSRSLKQEADTCIEWDTEVIRGFLAFETAVTQSATSIAAERAGLDAAVAPIVEALALATLAALQRQFAAGDRQIPPVHDKELLRVGRLHYAQSKLTDTERTGLRDAFIRLVVAQH